jgi:hypothetical protein
MFSLRKTVVSCREIDRATAAERRLARCNLDGEFFSKMNPDEMTDSELVTALFRTRDAADAAMGDLMTSGFHADEIQLLAPEDAGETGAARGVGRAGSALPVDDVVPGIVAPAGPAGIGPATGFGGGYPLTADSGPGGVMAAMAMLRMPAESARFFSDEVRGGRTLIAVRAGPRAAIARAILARNGGETAPAKG